MRLFILGVGFSGRAIARELAGEAQAIGGTTRSPEKAQALAADGIEALLFDGTWSEELAAALARTTHLVMSISPDHGGDPVIPLLSGRLAERMPALAWIGYLSTVGVYGDHDGAWVDETSECRPVSRRSVARLQAEEAWSALGAEAGVPVALIRLSGIYGPGRNTFVNLKNGTARRLIKPGQVFNRIHVDDIAGATALLARARLGGAWNVTDDHPAPPQDLVTFAARLMGIDPPEEVPFEQAELSPMARSFYGENKRVSNAKIKAASYIFRNPEYRESLARMFERNEW